MVAAPVGTVCIFNFNNQQKKVLNSAELFKIQFDLKMFALNWLVKNA